VAGTTRYHDLFGDDLFKKETDMKLFIGRKVVAETGEVGTIDSAFGASGKFKVTFRDGTTAKPGSKLFFKFKRYMYDPQKEMCQDEECLQLDLTRPVEDEDAAAGGLGSAADTSGTVSAGGGREDTADATAVDVAAAAAAAADAAAAAEPAISAPPPASAVPAATAASPPPPAPSTRQGALSKYKSDPKDDGTYDLVIVDGFFGPEEDVKPHVGGCVTAENGDVGVLTGAFGKAGKCKVSFTNGTKLPLGAALTLALAGGVE